MYIQYISHVEGLDSASCSIYLDVPENLPTGQQGENLRRLSRSTLPESAVVPNHFGTEDSPILVLCSSFPDRNVPPPTGEWRIRDIDTSLQRGK